MTRNFQCRTYVCSYVAEIYNANFGHSILPMKDRELFARHYFQKHLPTRGTVPMFADCWRLRTGLPASTCLHYLYFRVDCFCMLHWLQSSENRPRPPASLWFIGLQLDSPCVNQIAIFTTLPRQLRMNWRTELRNLCLEACGIITNTKYCISSLKNLKFKKLFPSQTRNMMSCSVLSEYFSASWQDTES